MIDFPEELDLLREYWPPDLGGLYWGDKDVFGRPDTKPKRPCVVVALPDENRPDLIVVRRSPASHKADDRDTPGSASTRPRRVIPDS